MKQLIKATPLVLSCVKRKNGYLFKYVTNKKIYEREYEVV